MNSILQETKKCYKCPKTQNLHKHHIYFGANRKKADIDGCWVWLCPKHHNMSDNGVHFDKEFDNELKKECQKQWQKVYNKTKEDFLKRYYRNYL